MSKSETFHTSPGTDRESVLIDRFSVKRHLCVLLLLSLTLKLFLLGQIEVITDDCPRYINLAIQLTHGDFWAAVKGDITFVYSLVIGALGFVFFDLVLVARLLSLAASVLTVIPLYLLFHDIWNKRIAFLSCSFLVILLVLQRICSRGDARPSSCWSSPA